MLLCNTSMYALQFFLYRLVLCAWYVSAYTCLCTIILVKVSTCYTLLRASVKGAGMKRNLQLPCTRKSGTWKNSTNIICFIWNQEKTNTHILFSCYDSNINWVLYGCYILGLHWYSSIYCLFLDAGLRPTSKLLVFHCLLFDGSK